MIFRHELPALTPGQMITLAGMGGPYRPVRVGTSRHVLPLPLSEQANAVLQSRLWPDMRNFHPLGAREIHPLMGAGPETGLNADLDRQLLSRLIPVPLPPAHPRPLGPQPKVVFLPPLLGWITRVGDARFLDVEFDPEEGMLSFVPNHPVFRRMIRDLPGSAAILLDDRVVVPGNPSTLDFFRWLASHRTSRLAPPYPPMNPPTRRHLLGSDEYESLGRFKLRSGRMTSIGHPERVVLEALEKALREVELIP